MTAGKARTVGDLSRESVKERTLRRLEVSRARKLGFGVSDNKKRPKVQDLLKAIDEDLMANKKYLDVCVMGAVAAALGVNVVVWVTDPKNPRRFAVKEEDEKFGSGRGIHSPLGAERTIHLFFMWLGGGVGHYELISQRTFVQSNGPDRIPFAGRTGGPGVNDGGAQGAASSIQPQGETRPRCVLTAAIAESAGNY